MSQSPPAPMASAPDYARLREDIDEFYRLQIIENLATLPHGEKASFVEIPFVKETAIKVAVGLIHLCSYKHGTPVPDLSKHDVVDYLTAFMEKDNLAMRLSVPQHNVANREALKQTLQILANVIPRLFQEIKSKPMEDLDTSLTKDIVQTFMNFYTQSETWRAFEGTRRKSRFETSIVAAIQSIHLLKTMPPGAVGNCLKALEETLVKLRVRYIKDNGEAEYERIVALANQNP